MGEDRSRVTENYRWTWDPSRGDYYYHVPLENCWIYRSGVRLYLKAEPRQWSAANPSTVLQPSNENRTVSTNPRAHPTISQSSGTVPVADATARLKRLEVNNQLPAGTLNQTVSNPTTLGGDSDWIWSEEHNDHYTVEWGADGSPIYIWARQQRPRSDSASHQSGYYSASQAPKNEPQGQLTSYQAPAAKDVPTYQGNSRELVSEPYGAQDQSATEPIDTISRSKYQAQYQSTAKIDTGQVVSKPSGAWVQGSNGDKERLDPSYRVRKHAHQFFEVGRMFSVLFTEAAGAQLMQYNDSVSEVKYAGEYAFTQIRRFIVVQQRKEFCFACPVFTYGGRGTMKPGLDPCEHAIVYTDGYTPTLLHGEAPLEKQAIAVKAGQGVQPLSIASRLHFGIFHPIQYNVKVKDLGKVCSEHMPYLIGYWRGELFQESAD